MTRIMQAAVFKALGKPRILSEWPVPNARPVTCVQVGLSSDDVPSPLFDVVAKRIPVRGLFARMRKETALAFAAGELKVDSELQPLSTINAVFDRVEHGQVVSRVVRDFGSQT